MRPGAFLQPACQIFVTKFFAICKAIYKNPGKTNTMTKTNTKTLTGKDGVIKIITLRQALPESNNP
jgi:hypothetical protein